MAGYVVESMFTLDDKASRVLLNLIKNIEAADKALQSVQKMLTDTGVALFNVGTKGKMASDTFGMLFPALSKTNAQLTGMAGRMDTVATALTDTAKAGESLNVVVGDMVGQMERLSLAAKTAQTSVLGVGRGMGRSGGRMALGAEAAALGGRGLGVGGMFGGALNAALLGMIGYQGIKSITGPVMEYNQARAAMTAFGLSPQEMARVDAATRATAQQIPQLTYAQTMKTAREVYGAMGKGHLQDALNILPTIAKSQVILGAFAGQHPGTMEGMEHLGATMARSAEMLGIAQNPKKLQDFIEQMTRGIIGHGGLVSPAQVGTTLNYLRASRYGKNQQFLTTDLLYLLGQASIGGSGGGGGTRGTAPMFTALDTLFFQGKMNKMQYANYVSTGMMKPAAPGQMLNTTTIRTLVNTSMKDIDKFLANPVEWLLTTYTEGLAKFIHKPVSTVQSLDQVNLRRAVQLYSPGLNKIEAGAIATVLAERQQILKGRALVAATPAFNKEYELAAKTLNAASLEVSAGFKKLAQDIGSMPGIINPISEGLKNMSRWLQETDTFVVNFNKDFPSASKTMGDSLDLIGKTANAIEKLLGPATHILQFVMRLDDWLVTLASNPIIAFLDGLFGKGAATGTTTAPAPPDIVKQFPMLAPTGRRSSAADIIKHYGHTGASAYGLVPPPPAVLFNPTQPTAPISPSYGSPQNKSWRQKTLDMLQHERGQLGHKPKEISMAPININFYGNINDFEHFKNKLSDAMNRAQKIAMKQFAGSNAGQSPWTDPIATG